jgi:hypothetical protein
MNLEFKPDLEQSLQRVYAWLEGEIIDRVPVQFHRHDMTKRTNRDVSKWANLKERWFDAEYQVTKYLQSIKERTFIAETFPVFWPNLGPDVYAAFYGIELEYGEETSWAKHLTGSILEITDRLKLNWESDYLKKIDEITSEALKIGKEKFITGYSDFHPGMDTVAAWRDPQQFCIDLIMYPDETKKLIDIANQDFNEIYNYYPMSFS